MSKTEQDLDASTDAALTGDAELIEVDATPEGLDRVVTDDHADDEVSAPTTNGARTGPAGLDDTAEVELDGTHVDDLLDTDDEPDADDLADADAEDALDIVTIEVDHDDLDDTAELDAADLDQPDAEDADTEDADTEDAATGTADAELDVEHDDANDNDDDNDADNEDASADLDVSDDAVDDEFIDEGSNPFEIPPILIATEEDDSDALDRSNALDRVDSEDDDDHLDAEDDVDNHEQDHTPGGTPLAPPLVSRDILEELRRADVDGPIVEMAPQDDTTSARRRPKKPVDYDPAPVPIPLQVPRILGRKPRVRKVTRVVRHVDPWSVFKIAIIANMVLYLVVLTASVLLWNVAYATGTVDNVERFFESFGWQSFEFNGGEIYHSLWIAGLFIVLGLTGLAVLGATLFNLITDLVGGVRFTVLEEEVVESRTSPMRRFVVRRPEPEIPAVIHDPSGSIIREAIVDDTGDIAR